MTITFKFNGFEYRTSDGIHVEGHDGNSWNRTHSIPVIVEARKQFAAAERRNDAKQAKASIRTHHSTTLGRRVTVPE